MLARTLKMTPAKVDYDVEKAQVSIVYIDEIDKISKGDNPSITRDVSGGAYSRRC